MTSLAVVFPAVLPIPFGDAKDQGFSPIDWTLVEQIEREADANDTVGAALSILVQTTFRGGITLTFTEHGEEQAVDAWFEENIIGLEWQPTLEKMLKHLVYFGFACITYVTSRTSGERVPQILDIGTYSIYYRYDETGARHYVIYPMMPGPAQRARDPGMPLDNARLFFSNEPDSLGRITSRIRTVLQSLLAAEQLQQNMLDADRERTHPAYVYERASAKGAAALTVGDSISMAFGENQAMVHEHQIRGEISDMDRVHEAIAVSSARRSNAQQTRPAFDKHTGTLGHRLIPLPWEKYKNVPVDHVLKAPPVPQILPSYIETQRVLSSRISLACGVPLPLLGEVGGGAGSSSSSAGFENSLGVLRDHVLSHQKRFSNIIATMYIDIYHAVHQEKFELKISEFQKTAGRLLTDAEMIVLQRQFFVRARFKSPPAFRFEDVMRLRDANVIGRETAQQLALGVFNLPVDMALSEKDEEHERMRDARIDAHSAKLQAKAVAETGGGGGGDGGGKGESAAKKRRVEKNSS